MMASKSLHKIILTGNVGWYLYNFRLSLARGLRERGVEVVFASPRDAFTEKIERHGFRCCHYPMQRSSLSPIAAAASVAGLRDVYRRERPDLVHHFTPKCVFFGTLAATLAGVPAIVNSVTGLGHLAIDKRLRYRALFAVEKVLYRRALVRKNVRVIVQNYDDLSMLTDLDLIDRAHTHLVRGSGVDTDRYKYNPDAVRDDPPSILYASRLLEPKGIRELVEAARLLRAKGVRARFLVAGEPDPGNPTAISSATLDKWRAEGAIELLGHVDPIDDLIQRASVVVLPSYREGMPKILLEASAMGRAVVTTDVPGCREAVEDGVNGFIVPPMDALRLADALERLIRDPQLCIRMGAAGRDRVAREFSADRILEETYAVYRKSVGLDADDVPSLQRERPTTDFARGKD